MTQDPMRLTSPTMEGDQLVWEDELLKALNGPGISTGLIKYLFTERLLVEDVKATFYQAALNIGICTVDNSIKHKLK